MIFGGIQHLSLVDYPGKTSAVVFTVGCNMRCGYCHNPELVLPERFERPLHHDDVFDFLKRRQGKLEGIVVSGGEPTEHEDLADILKRIKDLGFLVKLDTNGTRPAYVETLLRNNLLDYIAMDVKAPLATYSLIAARPIHTPSITKSIKHILDSGIPHEFRTTVVQSQLTATDIEDIGQLVQGASRFALQKFVPAKTLSPQFARMTAYTDKEMNSFQNIMLRYVKTCVVH